ncbi:MULTISPECIES: hypothetical protein [unclassified Streptomyces]|uniref:hypothetical protein n=1 Tax=unclassified Streptomyces TaxID=2593676 RepID=UPI0030CF6D83
MRESGERRRAWRRIVVVWAVAVTGGGVLTLWLQASAEPPPPTGRYTYEQGGREAPSPPSGPPTPPCPSSPEGGPVLCVYVDRP